MTKIQGADHPLDYHEEFDFFFNPMAKEQLRALRRKLNELPPDERLYEEMNYAVRRGLYRNAKTTVLAGEAAGQKKPENGQAVMPGFERLRVAYKWLTKLEEYEGEKKELIEREGNTNGGSSELPF